MILSKTLQRVGEWIEGSARVSAGAVSGWVSTGPLKDSLKELSDMGGAVGAVFKIASWVIPEPTGQGGGTPPQFPPTWLSPGSHVSQQSGPVL